MSKDPSVEKRPFGRRFLETITRFEIVLTALVVGAAWTGDFGLGPRGPSPVDIDAMTTTVGDLRTLHALSLIHISEPTRPY